MNLPRVFGQTPKSKPPNPQMLNFTQDFNSLQSKTPATSTHLVRGIENQFVIWDILWYSLV